jgi:CoA:oxalate CoA-transferase
VNEVAGTGPLDGLRVVEVGTRRAGSFAGAILADLGADVVKVEQHVAADVPPDGPEAADRIAFDRNKRSVAVDLGRPGGLEVIARLVARSEVLLDELRPAELSGLGLGGPAVPAGDGDRQLVHCSITPFGPVPSGPVPAMHPGCEDLLVQALSGNMDLTGEAGGPPFELGIPLGDLGAGVYAAIGVLGALAGGAGGRVEIAKVDVAVALLSYMAVGWFADGVVPTRVGTGHSTIFPYNAFRVLDGEVVVAPFTQRFWRNFATAIGREDLTQVDSYRNFAGRLREKEALMRIFEPILAERTVADWLETFVRADVPCGPVLTVQGALELDHTAERGMTPSFRNEDGAAVRTAGSPFRFRYADGTTYLPQVERPPRPGEHTESLLADVPAGARAGAGED